MSTPICSYRVSHSTPTVSTYRNLRWEGSLSNKSIAAATAGLPNSLFCVQVLQESPPAPDALHQSDIEPPVVGMGRIIGDGGCFYQIVDIVVLPDHHGRGLGKLIMRELMRWVHENVPETGYVSLIADGRANELYRQFGFVEVAPRSVGMAYRVGPLVTRVEGAGGPPESSA